jgi:tRNA(Ile)-lysidine synthase
VAHLNHSFRGAESEEDARFVAVTAREWGLPLTMRTFDVPQYARKRKLSPEEAAREVRYAFLGALAHEHGADVAVAHNADDQAETVLMNILRGTALSGLAGMKTTAPLPVVDESAFLHQFGKVGEGEAIIYRPLLTAWRREIEEYCRAAQLEYRTDRTNSDLIYTRNRIRHELIPLLEQRYNPAVRQHLVTLSRLASDEDAFMRQLAESEAARLANVDTAAGSITFHQAEMDEMPPPLRRRIVRWAMEQIAGTLEGMTSAHVAAADRIIAGEDGSPAALHLPHELVVEQQAGVARFYKRGVAPGAMPTSQEVYTWPVITPGGSVEVPPGCTLNLGTGWVLTSALLEQKETVNEPGDLLAIFDYDALPAAGPLWLRTRLPGDYIRPFGMTRRKSLQDLFVDAKMPRRVRDVTPVLSLSRSAGEVLWVPGPGGRRSAHAPVGLTTRKVWMLEFIRPGEKGTDGTAAR